MKYDLVRMRASKSSKYDVNLKNSLFNESETLREALQIPMSAIPRSVEFSEIFAERMDSLFQSGDRFFHIEIQTKASTAMGWRMLDYLLKITAQYGQRNLQSAHNIKQLVLYVGTKIVNWEIKVETRRFAYECPVRDIRTVFEDPQAFLDPSCHPDDWVLAVVCMPMPDFGHWRKVASMLARLSSDIAIRASLQAKLLLFATLRELPLGQIQ